MDRSLYTAKDAQELLGVFSGVSGTLTPWILLWPNAERQTMVWQGALHDLDALVAGPIAQIPFSRTNQVVSSESDSGDRLIGMLAYQFPFAEATVAMAPVWAEDGLFAIVGLSGEVARDDDAKRLVREFTSALRNLHEKEALHQELHGCQFLLTHIAKPWLLARKDGSILATTPSGTNAVNMIIYGGRRRNLKEFMRVVPGKISAAMRAGAQEVTLTDEITAIVAPLSPRPGATVQPLFIVDFRVEAAFQAIGIEDAALETLTPAQREVYDLLVQGLRNKEIGARLSISPHTARHHVSEVLQKLRCVDRLQLVARSHQGGSRSNPVRPVSGKIPSVTPPADLPLPVRHADRA